MKAKKIIYLLLPSLMMVIFCGSMFSKQAAAQEGVGGAVQTNGHIGFYQDEVPESSSTEESSSTSTTEPSTESTTPSSSTVTKPTGGGNYPSTGELVKKSLSISGVALIAMVLLLFLYKRRKKEAEE